MRPDQIKKAADEFEIPLKYALKMRVRYLQNLLERLNAYIDEQTDVMPESDVMAVIGELITIRKYQDRVKSGVVLKGITDEMIQQARDYPIENVIEFQRGVAIAFCHEDKRPSLTWHKAKNRATCFPCGKSFSALDVAIERDGFSFIEAVKMLSN